MANSLDERIVRAVLNDGSLDWEHEIRDDVWRYGDTLFTYHGAIAVDRHGVEMKIGRTADLVAAREAADTAELLGLSFVFAKPCNNDKADNNDK